MEEVYVTGSLFSFFFVAVPPPPFFPYSSLKVEERLKDLKALYCLQEKEEVVSVDLVMGQA